MRHSRTIGLTYLVAGSFGLLAWAILRLDYFFAYAVDKPRLGFCILATLLSIGGAWLVGPKTPTKAAVSVTVSFALVLLACCLFVALSANSRLNLFDNAN